ncbi:hypothetical protein Droror1_Dr00003578 [Drosera rotundifolia]
MIWWRSISNTKMQLLMKSTKRKRKKRRLEIGVCSVCSPLLFHDLVCCVVICFSGILFHEGGKKREEKCVFDGVVYLIISSFCFAILETDSIYICDCVLCTEIAWELSNMRSDYSTIF